MQSQQMAKLEEESRDITERCTNTNANANANGVGWGYVQGCEARGRVGT